MTTGRKEGENGGEGGNDDGGNKGSQKGKRKRETSQHLVPAAINCPKKSERLKFDSRAIRTMGG